MIKLDLTKAAESLLKECQDRAPQGVSLKLDYTDDGFQIVAENALPKEIMEPFLRPALDAVDLVRLVGGK